MNFVIISLIGGIVNGVSENITGRCVYSKVKATGE